MGEIMSRFCIILGDNLFQINMDLCQIACNIFVFRPTRSNLMEFTYFGQTGMRNGSQIDVIYTYFAKAFDRVNHKILIKNILQPDQLD